MDINKLEKAISKARDEAESVGLDSITVPFKEADMIMYYLELLKNRHSLEVHNIGNVDIPEGVSSEHFHLVMDNVVDALEHTEKGESWPYDDK